MFKCTYIVPLFQKTYFGIIQRIKGSVCIFPQKINKEDALLRILSRTMKTIEDIKEKDAPTIFI